MFNVKVDLGYLERHSPVESAYGGLTLLPLEPDAGHKQVRFVTPRVMEYFVVFVLILSLSLVLVLS